MVKLLWDMDSIKFKQKALRTRQKKVPVEYSDKNKGLNYIVKISMQSRLFSVDSSVFFDPAYLGGSFI